VYFITYYLFELEMSLDIPSYAVTCQVIFERREEGNTDKSAQTNKE
jgi:hypothetical protein